MRPFSMIFAAAAVLLLALQPGRAQEAPLPAGPPDAPPPAVNAVTPGERLSLDRCVEIALHRSPAIRAAAGGVTASAGRIGQARSAWYPQVSASGGYSRYSLVTDPTDATLEQYTAGATLSQTLFDFGRTWSAVTVQQQGAAAAGEDLRETRARVVLNVKRSYYGLLRAGKNRDVLQETVRLFEQHLAQAKGFFEAGVKSRFDVTKAEVDLSTARLNLIRAENALRIARVTLNNAMGLADPPAYEIADDLSFQKVSLTLDEAREKAFLDRPDVRASAARRQAAEASLSLARRGHFPTLTGSATYTRTEADFPPEPDGWSAGVTLTVPLFSGFLTSSQVKEAKGNLYAARANEETLRQDVLLDVQQSYLNLLEAEERVDLAELTVKQAEENYAIAKGRYEAGVGSPIEETDALVALSNARVNYIAALADYKVAEAALRKAMGE